MLNLRQILLPVDFSEQCAGAGRYAQSLATRFQSELILLHAIPRPHLEFGGPEVSAPAVANVTEEIRASSKKMLDSFLASELEGLNVRRILREDDAARTIVEFVSSNDTDLIVMPTRGYGPFRRFLVGSVVAKVLHDADCPVWTGVHLEDAPVPESLSLKRIVCAVDLSPHSKTVLSWASDIAAAFDARLTAFHVTTPITVAVTGGVTEPRAEREEQARGELEDLLAAAGVSAEITVESGDLTKTIYDHAARLPADLLVIGRGAVKGIAGRLRSDAYSIIRESPCPVVSV